jgi:HAD superfamily hydrolase (TIGR01509 family)
MNRALIFDCDGVLADTEKFGHLPAFNQMWKEFGVPWRWSVEAYGRKLRIAGGKERMVSLFQDPDFLAVYRPPVSEEGQKALVAAWHKRKSEIYKEVILSGKIPPRAGVKRLAQEALKQGWALAVASTSAKESVDAVIRYTLGDETHKELSVVLAGDVVKQKKPAPDIYNLAAEKLKLSPSRCVVIEDTRQGLLACIEAGMRCVVTVSTYSKDEDFHEAAIVLTSLGDPKGERCEVIQNRSNARPGFHFTVKDMEAVLLS